MSSLRLTCFALTLALLAPVAAQEAEPKPALPEPAAAFETKVVGLAKHLRSRTVLVFGLIGLGSGAVVTPEGRIVTNAHVVAGARYAIVQWADGTSVLARRRGIDYGVDLAVLEPEQPLEKKVPAFTLAPARAKTGDWVVAGGFPGGLRTNSTPTISLGKVTGRNPKGGAQVMGMLDYSGAMRSDVPIFSGNSGGPLIDLQGRLVGINGAVDLERAISMTIPIETVQQRLRSLRGDVIVLPGGRRLDPAKNGLLKRLFSLLDPMGRSMPKRIREASEQAARARKRIRRGVQRLPLETARIPNDRLANVARKGARQACLATAFGDLPGALRTRGGLHLTRIGPRRAVLKASRLGSREQVTLADGGQATVLARSPEDDLALVQLPGPAVAPAADAPAPAVGSLVCVAGAKGKLAYGIASVDERPTSSAVLNNIQQGSSQKAVLGALKGIERMAKMFRIESLQQLLAQIRKSMEMREAFAGGTTPRDYAAVLSIDAPLPPSAVGSPVYDRSGRLIGVSIGVAHHGTSYVVPIARVRRAFRAALRKRTGSAPAPAPKAPGPKAPEPKAPEPTPKGREF